MRKKDRTNEATPLGDIVNRLMKAYQLDEKLEELDVLARWEEMMGKAVALRTKSIHIKDKVLIVEIDSSVMREELLFGKNVILQRVNQYAGKEIVTDVFFK